MHRGIGIGVALSLLGLGLGCDSGGSSTSSDIAAAMGHVVKGKEEAEAKVNASARMDALKAAAEADAEKAKAEAFAALIKVPAEVPGDLEAGCAEAALAYDGYNTGRLAGDELKRWQATKQPDLDKLTDSCKRLGSPQVAACQASAFTNAGPLFVADDAPFIISKCEDLADGSSPKTAAL